MSGPENLRGVDFQISSSLLLTLSALTSESSPLSTVRIESLDDLGEDLVFVFQNGGVRQIQLKKLAEGYNWTPAGLRPILAKFSRLDRKHSCVFVSDGSASRQLTPLKNFLENGGHLDQEDFDAVCGEDLTPEALASLAGRVRLETRFFPSPDEVDPARFVKMEVHRSLLRGPFSLDFDVKEVAERLWNIVYSAARSGSTLSRDVLLREFAVAGLNIQQQEWLSYPTARRFCQHSVSLDSLIQTIYAGGLALIYGIPGSGKTALAAEAAAMAATERPTCWIKLTDLVEPTEVVRTLGAYCASCGLSTVAEALRSAEPSRMSSAVAHALAQYPISLVLDRLEAASTRLSSFLQETLFTLPSSKSSGSILATSTYLPNWWEDFERGRSGVYKVSLAGLPTESALSMLSELDTGVEERRELVEAVGCHAQSLALLLQLGDTHDGGQLALYGVDAARDWVLRRVLDALSENQKRTLARLSIFDYSVRVEHASLILDDSAPDVLRSLQRRDLLRIDLGTLTVHDAVRRAALELITQQSIEKCHRTVADQLFSILVRAFELEGSVLYEDAIRWATHLEAAGDVSELGGRYAFILNCEGEILRALFGIAHYGFPYEFDDPGLDTAFETIEHLESCGLVRETGIQDGSEETAGPLFVLKGFSYFEIILVDSLCLHHGYAGHLGYMPEMRPNFAFGQQGIACPYEHCIELSPLPTATRAEWEALLADDRKRLADPQLYNLNEGHLEFIRARVEEGVPEWVQEEVDQELVDRACPIFGHGCPGGSEQAATCASNESEYFEWAVNLDAAKHPKVL